MTPRRLSRPRGAALLLAMIVLTLVATAAAGMVWQQQRAIHIEAAERARTQANWMLDAMIDFGRYAIRTRTGSGAPSKGAPWDLEIQESSIASLLAADRDNNADSTLQAFIAGYVEDAQSRYNLANVVNGNDGTILKEERETLERLCQLAGAPGLAPAIAAALSAARTTPAAGPQLDGVPATTPVLTRVEHLRWLGIDEPTLTRLMQLVDLLPGAKPTKLNLNTASAEVIEAVLGPAYGAGIGQRLTRVGAPSTSRFDSIAAAQAAAGLPATTPLPEGRVDIRSDVFYLLASVRFEDRALAARALVEREGTGSAAPVHIRRQERGPLPPGVTLSRGVTPALAGGPAAGRSAR